MKLKNEEISSFPEDNCTDWSTTRPKANVSDGSNIFQNDASTPPYVTKKLKEDKLNKDEESNNWSKERKIESALFNVDTLPIKA